MPWSTLSPRGALRAVVVNELLQGSGSCCAGQCFQPAPTYLLPPCSVSCGRRLGHPKHRPSQTHLRWASKHKGNSQLINNWYKSLKNAKHSWVRLIDTIGEFRQRSLSWAPTPTDTGNENANRWIELLLSLCTVLPSSQLISISVYAVYANRPF